MIKKGFTLIQLMILLMIASISIVSVMNMMSKNAKKTEKDNYMQQLEVIDKAVLSYAAKYRALPLPQTFTEFSQQRLYLSKGSAYSLSSDFLPIYDNEWNIDNTYKKMQYIPYKDSIIDENTLCKETKGLTLHYCKNSYNTNSPVVCTTPDNVTNVAYALISPAKNGNYDVVVERANNRIFVFHGVQYSRESSQYDDDDIIKITYLEDLKYAARCFEVPSVPSVRLNKLPDFVYTDVMGANKRTFQIPLDVPNGLTAKCCIEKSFNYNIASTSCGVKAIGGCTTSDFVDVKLFNKIPAIDFKFHNNTGAYLTSTSQRLKIFLKADNGTLVSETYTVKFK